MSEEWYGKKADKSVPLTDTFIRACIKTGTLTPPPGSDTERLNRITAYVVICCVVVGAVIIWVATLSR